MKSKRWYVLILTFLIISIPPSLYAESIVEALQKISDPYPQASESLQEAADPAVHPASAHKETTKKQRLYFIDCIEKQAYAVTYAKRNEKKLLREAWREWLGLDIYYPYYKAQEVEDWASEKLKVRVFKLQGRPRMENNQFRYTFSTKF